MTFILVCLIYLAAPINVIPHKRLAMVGLPLHFKVVQHFI